MLKVLGRTTSLNVQKVLWLLDELDMAYAHENVGGPFGGNREQAYLDLNPNGTVPTLIDGEFVLWESNAVMRYIANQYGGGRFYPEDIRARALVDQWTDWQTSTLMPSLAPMFQGVVFDKRAPTEMPDAIAASERKLQILDRHLKGRSFMCAEALSLAEFALGSCVYRWFHFGVGTEPLADLRRWYDHLTARPAFQKHIMVGVPNFTPPAGR